MFVNTSRTVREPRVDQPALRPPPADDARPHRIRFHDLRHTHASLLIMDGVPVKVVSERLGHANVAFTMHTYQHLLPGMSAAAARQFAALLAAHAGRRLPARSERNRRSAHRTRPSR
jgi:hypothetical protein